MTSSVEQGGIRVAGGAVWGTVGGPPRMDALTVTEYAQAIAARERILDEAQVRKYGDTLVGDLVGIWTPLRDHAMRFGLPYVEGDLERTNRVSEWDQLVMNEEATQRTWLQEYPRALLRVCSIDPDDGIGRRVSSHLESQPTLMWNAFVPLAVRRPDLTNELRAHAYHARSSLPPPPVSAVVASPDRSAVRPVAKDVAVFRGEKLPNLSDFARVERAVQSGNFSRALYREGLDPVEYARLCDRWTRRLAADPELRAEYAKILRRQEELASKPITEPLPMIDTVVFPGQKLARVSDFARISRAAQRGEFKEALERAGVDTDTFANLCARFNARMQEDKAVEEQFKRLLADPRVD